MKILHLSTAWTWRGGEQQIIYLWEELNKQGIEQLIFCTRDSAMELYCKKNKIPFESRKKRSSFDLGFARAVKKASDIFSADVIHMHDSHAHTFAVLSALIFGNKKPMVLSRRVDFPVSSSWFSTYKYNYPAIKKIICVSDKIKEVMSPAIKNKEKLITIHSGIDIRKFQDKINKGILRRAFSLDAGTILIGNISALADHKDYFTFIDTAKILVNEKMNVRFFIIGEGEQKEEIRKYLVEKNLENYVYLTGFRNDIADILGELDVFLVTSKTEGLGTTILDAFASNVVVVATAAGGIPEIVINGETGLLSPIGDSRHLANNINKLIKDDVLKHQLITNAAASVEKFGKPVTAGKTVTVYNDILISK